MAEQLPGLLGLYKLIYLFIYCFSLNICGDDNNIFTTISFFCCYTSFRSTPVVIMT